MGSEDSDLFPRDQHPDHRPNKEWLLMMGFIKPKREKGVWYPKPRGDYRKPIKCVNNGKDYLSVKDASKDLGIDASAISRVLVGKITNTKGHRFKYI